MIWSCTGNNACSCGHSLSRGYFRLCERGLRFSRYGMRQTAATQIVARYRAQYQFILLVSARWLSTPSTARVKQRHALDRDVILSVLEASATRRDAKGYLQKYASEDVKSLARSSKPFESQRNPPTACQHDQNLMNVAIVTIRNPQDIQDNIILGIAKTLTQLRTLGLLSLVVVDCGIQESGSTFKHEALRLCEKIDTFGKPGTRLSGDILELCPECPEGLSSLSWDNMRVVDHGLLARTLGRSMIGVIPSLASESPTSTALPVDGHRTVLSLTRYLTGMQFEDLDGDLGLANDHAKRLRGIASVERIIILDNIGGVPMPGRPGACQRFVNVEQEYDALFRNLEGLEELPAGDSARMKVPVTRHAINLKLARDTLSLLPATSSALITTPFAAANTNMSIPASGSNVALGNSQLSFDGMVITRRKQNPLLHNLLTDKPILSASLPLQRVQKGNYNSLHAIESSEATLVKQGMSLTIYPDPCKSPWRPPQPGSQRLRLTDQCIDLPRLVNLIEDSFGRKLDVEQYLKRVNENLAGVIIAGEYEGGAVLTWEQPAGLDSQTAYEYNRYVPYLDKFAVLKSRQGSGGVADIIFNAMVRNCFPNGVCWRSRKENPVNKWYFERSAGTTRLSNCNWTMFWTTLELHGKKQTLEDYEIVCRGIELSWAKDNGA